MVSIEVKVKSEVVVAIVDGKCFVPDLLGDAQ